MSEKDFTLLAWRYATGRIPIDVIEALWVEMLERPERLDLLITIGGITIICNKTIHNGVGL